MTLLTNWTDVGWTVKQAVEPWQVLGLRAGRRAPGAGGRLLPGSAVAFSQRDSL